MLGTARFSAPSELLEELRAFALQLFFFGHE